MFDPRLTEEYCGLAGMPYSNQDASGEIAAMAINASLWGLFNFTSETGSGLTKPGQIGCQYGYVNLRWMPGSPMFSKARASGLRVADWQNVITVNMLGKRFYDETGRQYTANNYKGVDPYAHGSYLNAKNVRFEPNNWINAAMAGIGDGHNGGGADLGDLRFGGGRAREVGSQAAERRHRGRLLLQPPTRWPSSPRRSR